MLHAKVRHSSTADTAAATELKYMHPSHKLVTRELADDTQHQCGLT
jgi:hypothetical protein